MKIAQAEAIHSKNFFLLLSLYYLSSCPYYPANLPTVAVRRFGGKDTLAEMSELGGFIHDVYASGKSRFLRGLALTAASGLAGGLGILLIVPLLALAGLGVSSPGVLGRLAGIFSSMESGFRLAAVLGAYILILSAQALVDRASYLVETEISSEFS